MMTSLPIIIHGGYDPPSPVSDNNVEQMLLQLRRHQNSPMEAIEKRRRIKDRFWQNLKTQYLLTLRTAKYKANNITRRHTDKLPKKGQVVMIHDSDMRDKWRMGIVLELIQGSDGKVREAKVRTTIPAKNLHRDQTMGTRVYKKAIVHLHPLELECEFYNELQNENEFRHNRKVSTNLNNEENEAEEEDEGESTENLFNKISEIESEFEACKRVDCIEFVGNKLSWIRCDVCHSW